MQKGFERTWYHNKTIRSRVSVKFFLTFKILRDKILNVMENAFITYFRRSFICNKNETYIILGGEI